LVENPKKEMKLKQNRKQERKGGKGILFAKKKEKRKRKTEERLLTREVSIIGFIKILDWEGLFEDDDQSLEG
jgi:hypothetical protein